MPGNNLFHDQQLFYKGPFEKPGQCYKKIPLHPKRCVHLDLWSRLWHTFPKTMFEIILFFLSKKDKKYTCCFREPEMLKSLASHLALQTISIFQAKWHISTATYLTNLLSFYCSAEGTGQL